eukprot:gene11012-7655_t
MEGMHCFLFTEAAAKLRLFRSPSIPPFSSSFFAMEPTAEGEDGPSAPNEPITEAYTNLEEQLEQYALSATQPMENLPPLQAKELAAIGRCVTLSTKTTVGTRAETMTYEGLVSCVNAECITLLHCHRFIPLEHSTYRPLEDPGDVRYHQEDDAFHHMRDEAGHPYRRYASPFTEASLSEEDRTEEMGPEEGGTPIPAPDIRKVREKYTMGPMPAVTFIRKKFHSVLFAMNPPASFYSIFSDPEKRLMDMQYLRMFVRRYLVHTSQGNNPGGIPLQEFVAVRANCPTIEAALLEKVAKEELMALVKADAKMKSERSAMFQRRPGDLEMAPRQFNGREALEYTSIPRWTNVIAVMIGCFGIFDICFSLLNVYIFSIPALLFHYLTDYMMWFFAAAILSCASSIATFLHCRRLCMPLKEQSFSLGLRLLTTTAAMVMSVASLVMLIKGSKEFRFHDFYDKDASSFDKCAFFQQFRCSGYNAPDLPYAQAVCHLNVSGGSAMQHTPCGPFAVNKLRFIFYPVILYYGMMLLLLVSNLILVGAHARTDEEAPNTLLPFSFYDGSVLPVTSPLLSAVSFSCRR